MVDADAVLGGVIEDGHAHGTGLTDEADVAGRRHDRRERRVHRDVGRRIEYAQAVRSDEPHAVTSHRVHDRLLARATRTADFLEAGRNDDHGPHALAAALLDGIHHHVLRHGDDREVDRVAYVQDRRVRGYRVHGARVRIHRVDRTGEPVPDQVVQDLVSDRARRTAGPDDCNRLRPEHRVE